MTNVFLPLLLFCLVTLFTPGPNNLMLMTSGLNFGLQRTWSHILGVTLGFAFLVLCAGLGLGALFAAYPTLYTIIKYAGAVYLLYLAWSIAVSPPPVLDAVSEKRPMGFFAAVAFQWVNPKALVMAVGGVSTYALVMPYPYNVFVIAGMFGIIGLFSSLTWAGLGLVLQNFLHKPKWLRWFNIVMGTLLALSLYPVVMEAFH